MDRIAIACLLMVSLIGSTMPADAGAVAARLSGSIVHAEDQSPVPGARLLVGDATTGRQFSSTVAGPDGSFKMEGLPASTYRLAVETDAGLYVVQAPLVVEAGGARTLNLAVSRRAQDPDTAPNQEAGSTGGWDTPFQATMTVLGVAILLGVLLDDDDDDGTSASQSPFTPQS